MRTFKLPFSYTVFGEIEIEASNLNDAIAKFDKMAEQKTPTGHIPVLDKATKLEPDLDTLDVNKDEAADINPPTKYKVTIQKTMTVEVEVEASDEEEAEDIARTKVEDGECEDDYTDEEIEVADIEEIEQN
jgi:hypothetical protein